VGLEMNRPDSTLFFLQLLISPKIESLLQQMVLLFDTGSSMLARPPPDTVDYRAACFCHRAVVNMAHVCSNCLSVYCKAVPLCSTCNEFFPVDMPKKIQKKKR